jgi:hypothetical protein
MIKKIPPLFIKNTMFPINLDLFKALEAIRRIAAARDSEAILLNVISAFSTSSPELSPLSSTADANHNRSDPVPLPSELPLRPGTRWYPPYE